MARFVWMTGIAMLVTACGSSGGGTESTANGGAGGASTASHHPAGGADVGGGNAGGNGAGAGSSASTSTAASMSTSSSMSSSSGAGGQAPTCASPFPEYTHDDGSVTFYTFEMAGSDAVHCGFDILDKPSDKVAHVHTGDGRYIGALNTADYAGAAACGACVEVTRDGTRKVVITVVDECPTDTNPKCTAGHIDLSKEAFLEIGAENEGYLGMGNGGAFGEISWRYVACPVTGDVTYELKEPSNVYWNQILVEEHAYAIAKVEAMVGGDWKSGVRQSYNYWQVGDGNLGAAPYAIRATDVYGHAVTASLALKSGDQASSAQFPACQ